MASLEEALWAGCSGASAINDLIGLRLYPLKLPQNPTYPAAIYQRISNLGLLAHDGPAQLDTARFQFDFFGRSYSQARAVATAFRTYLEGYHGLMGEIRISVIVFENEIDAWGEEAGVFRLTQDYKIIHNI